MEKTVYTGKNEGKIMDTEVSISFNKLPFTCVLPLLRIFESDNSVVIFSAVAENTNSSDQHVFKLNVFVLSIACIG